MTKEDALFFLTRFRTTGINENLYEALGVAIKALSIQSEYRWIPCSERLPKNEVDVLCCRDNKTMTIMHFNPVLTTRYPKGFSVVKDAFSWRQDNVIAWMPLPEPYKEVEQDD